MKSHIRVIRVALSMIMVAACAHPAKAPSEPVSSAGAGGDVVTPPKIMAAAGTLKLRSRGGRIRGKVQVPVDASGRPDVFGIRFMGTFEELTKRDLIDYIGQQTFTPAKRNGLPTAGVFEMTFR
jgi:hypothetical protein